MPHKAVIAGVQGTALIVNAPAEATTFTIQVGDLAYAAKLAAAMNNVTTEFDDREKGDKAHEEKVRPHPPMPEAAAEGSPAPSSKKK